MKSSHYKFIIFPSSGTKGCWTNKQPFDGLKRPRTKIIGTEMARLNGAVYSFEMPNTKIHFTFPNERLYHINGLPREQYIPQVYIDWRKEEQKPGSDLFIIKALRFLAGGS